MEDFTKDFLDYAKKKNPSSGIVYVYKTETEVKIVNYMGEPVQLEYKKTLPAANQEIVERVVFDIGGIEFVHQVPVQLENFGTEWYTSGHSPTPLQISIGGILHNFGNFSGSGPEFKVLVRSESSEYEFDEIGNIDEGILYSPSKDLNKVVYVYEDK